MFDRFVQGLNLLWVFFWLKKNMQLFLLWLIRTFNWHTLLNSHDERISFYLLQNLWIYFFSQIVSDRTKKSITVPRQRLSKNVVSRHKINIKLLYFVKIRLLTDTCQLLAGRSIQKEFKRVQAVKVMCSNSLGYFLCSRILALVLLL